MAGLLPSEGKLRGSPANILGRCTARQNPSRVSCFQAPRKRRFLSAKSIPGQRRANASLTDEAHNTRYAKSPQSMRVYTIWTDARIRDRAALRRARRIIKMMHKSFATRCLEWPHECITHYHSRGKLPCTLLMFGPRDGGDADRSVTSSNRFAHVDESITQCRVDASRIASADHRGAKIVPFVPIRPSDPNPRLAGNGSF